MAPRGAPARRWGHARVIPASAEIIFSRAADRPYPEYDDLSSCVSCRDVDWTTVTTRVDFLWRTALVFPLRAALYAEREGGGRAAAHHALFFSTLQGAHSHKFSRFQPKPSRFQPKPINFNRNLNLK